MDKPPRQPPSIARVIDAQGGGMRDLWHMSALDPDVANQLAEDLPPDVFRTIIATFEEDLTRLAQELARAAQDGDQEAYERAAHSLAGAAAAVGAVGLEREARIAMDHRQPEPPASVLPRLLTEAKAALQALNALLN